MKPLFLIPVLAAALMNLSCTSFTLKPKFQRFEGEFELDGRILGSDLSNAEVDIEYAALGVEFGGMVRDHFECFTDISWIAFVEDDSDYSADGAEVGIGMRAPYPREEGWSLDWGTRLSVHVLTEDEDVLGIDFENEAAAGAGIDLNFGGRYAIQLDDNLIFCPRGGLLLKNMAGNWKAELLGIEVGDVDYEMSAAALYTGFRIYAVERTGVDLDAAFFAGSQELIGFMISAGVRF